MPATTPLPTSSLSRRRLLGGTVGLATATAAVPARVTAAFVAGSERLRVGLVGCGSRGTGAALQAAAADPAVEVVAIGDLFADRVAMATAILHRATGHRFACPHERRFVGENAWRRVIAADVDLVILATPPDCRPQHVAAAVAAGRHVFCETPAAIDFTGAATIAAACGTARDRGLSLMSGLAWRRDREMAALVEHIHGGVIGRPLTVRMTSLVGLPWHCTPQPGWTSSEHLRRNWVACSEQSGGDVVERQIHAIDKALWTFGDQDPLQVEPLPGAPQSPHSAGTHAIRLVFADGGSVTVKGGRRGDATDTVSEMVRGTRGTCDLRQACGSGRHGAAMAALVRGILSGLRVDDAAILCRATAASLLARDATTAAGPLPWATLPAKGGAPLQPV